MSAATIVNGLLKLHPEYAGGKAKGIQVEEDPAGSQSKAAAEWLNDVGELPNQSQV